MNKLVNLVIIFLSLQYLIPLIKIDIVQDNVHYANIFAALVIAGIQLIYNVGMQVSKRSNTTITHSIKDSLIKFAIVLGVMYIFEDIKSIDIPMVKAPDAVKSIFITLMITFSILLKCLIYLVIIIYNVFLMNSI